MNRLFHLLLSPFKFIAFFLLLHFLSWNSFAQKESNNWYFGGFAGIDFNSGAAVATTNSAMSALEGCAAISNHLTGDLLFYTDGIKVWNANHNVMTNGTGLTGNPSSAQSAIILQDPADSNLYYIFTAGEYFNGGSGGYRYSIVDMTQSGGLGAVTAIKNVLLYTPATEKLTAVKNAAGTGYWIATHEFNTNTFVLYELTASGLSAPVTSSTGTSYSTYTPIGCMTFSPDGTKLATILSGLDQVEFYDFDAATGILSNPVNLGPVTNNVPYVYGISFSPNGSRLYVDEENNNNLFQYDLTAGSLAAINASKTSVGTTSSFAMQALQLAPDGKLYVARNGSGYLAVVSDPDALGTACNFSDNGFYLAGANSAYGLSAFAQDIFSPVTSQQGNFSATDTTICEKFCIDYFDQSVNNPIAWHWEFPGAAPSSSLLQNPSNICYPFPGVYDVTLITTNASGNDTITFDDYITVYPPPVAPVISQNSNVLTSSIAATYQWQFDGVDIAGATSQSYTAQQTGLYTVIVSDENGCTNASSLYLVIDGIDAIGENTYFVIKPNPSAGIFNLEWFNNSPNNLSATPLTITILSASGSTIFSSEEKFSGDHFEKQIDLQAQTPGIYLLELKSAEVIIRKKIIIGR